MTFDGAANARSNLKRIGLIAALALTTFAAIKWGHKSTAGKVEPQAQKAVPSIGPSDTLALPLDLPKPTSRNDTVKEANSERVVAFLDTLIDLLEQTEGDRRSEAIHALIKGQEAAVLQELLSENALVESLPADVYESMLRNLASKDPPWTADYIQTMPPNDLRRELLGATMQQWAELDVAGSVEWAQKLEDRNLREAALVHLSHQWYLQDPDGALAFATVHASENRQLLTSMASRWLRDQPELAAEFLASRFKTPETADIIASVVADWATRDELAAAEFVMKLPSGKARDEATVSVVSALARTDPTLAAEVVQVFPEGSERNYAIENLVYRWAYADPDTALRWSSHLSPAERNVAIRAGVGRLVDSRPLLAAQWAATISDEVDRVQESERVVRTWMHHDPEAARQWVLASPIPQERKNALLAVLDNSSAQI